MLPIYDADGNLDVFNMTINAVIDGSSSPPPGVTVPVTVVDITDAAILVGLAVGCLLAILVCLRDIRKGL